LFPFAELERAAVARQPADRTRLPPVRLIGLQSLVCRFSHGSSGSPRRHVETRFRVRHRFRTNRPPSSFKAGFILSCLISSSEFLRRSSSPALSGRHVLPGFLPSTRRHRRCPLVAGARPLPLRSVLRFSQPLDGFLHLPALRACCIPQPRPGFHRSGASPIPQPSRLVAGPCLPAVVVSLLTSASAGCHNEAPRLRGFAPRSDAFLEVGV